MAWRAGAENLASLPGLDQRRLIVDTDAAWKEYASVRPPLVESQMAPLERATFEANVAQQQRAIEEMIEAHIESNYLDSLKIDPNNSRLRSRLLRIYIGLRHFDTAISKCEDYLLKGEGDKAAIFNSRGIAYYLKGEPKKAALNFMRAIDLKPKDERIRRNYERAMRAMGKGGTPTPGVEFVEQEELALKDGKVEVDETSFYWIE